MIKIKIKLDSGATMPTRALNGDTGYDIRVKSVTIRCYNFETNEWDEFDDSDINNTWENVTRPLKPDVWQVVIDTGVHLQPEEGWAFEGRPNSRNGKQLFRWSFSPATIDGNYTGSIKIILEPRYAWVTPNHAPKPYEVCGQLVLEEVHNADFIEVDELDETERGDGSFGSTACLAQNA